MDILARQKSLIGEENCKKLQNATVAVFGLGGVGSYTVEALARAGVGKLVICDNDVVCEHNINRQLYALSSTIGIKKVEVATQRINDINADIQVFAKDCFFSEQTATDFDFSSYDYVVDCIDTVTSKIKLIECAKSANVKVISCMGTGNKLNSQFLVGDIFKTTNCPLAKVMRHELKKRNITSLKCVYSLEIPVVKSAENGESKRTPASISYVPAIAGLTIAGEVIKDIIA